MEEVKEKEGKIVLEMTIGNTHIAFNDAYIVKSQEEIDQHIKAAERIIYDGIRKVPTKNKVDNKK